MKLTKGAEYSDSAKTGLVEMLPCIQGSILEIGCGSGATLRYLKSKGASFVAGVDINNEAIAIAVQRGLDFALAANIEKDEMPFKEKEFDCIIIADALEHLFNPWGTLKKVVAYLKDDGFMLLSIPNVKYYKIIASLVLHDEWTYRDEGILDNTHLRFFTLKEIKKLVDFAELKIVDIKFTVDAGQKFKIINALFFNKLYHFSVVQYYVMAKKRQVIRV